MQLRLLVETAAKALLVDHEMKFRSDVFTGMEELEKSLARAFLQDNQEIVEGFVTRARVSMF
jgi:hypothetical protein